MARAGNINVTVTLDEGSEQLIRDLREEIKSTLEEIRAERKRHGYDYDPYPWFEGTPWWQLPFISYTAGAKSTALKA